MHTAMLEPNMRSFNSAFNSAFLEAASPVTGCFFLLFVYRGNIFAGPSGHQMSIYDACNIEKNIVGTPSLVPNDYRNNYLL